MNVFVKPDDICRMVMKGSAMRLALLGIFLLVLSGCGVVSKNVQEESASKQPLSVQASEPETPLAVYAWINSHIAYKADSDGDGEFRSAEETLALGYGDCDDMAVLADYMLKQHGYTSNVVTVYTASEGHTVCVWQDTNGTYNHLSNKTYREIHAQKLRTVAADVYADWQVLVYYPDNSYEKRS